MSESNYKKIAPVPKLVGSGMRDKQDSGGGIGARNCRLVLRNSTVIGNTAHGFAGGGIFYNSSDEGVEFHDTMHKALRVLLHRSSRSAVARSRTTARPSCPPKLPTTGEVGVIYVLRYKHDYISSETAATVAEGLGIGDKVAFRADKLVIDLDAVDF